jgi:hypothetical protein
MMAFAAGADLGHQVSSFNQWKYSREASRVENSIATILMDTLLGQPCMPWSRAPVPQFLVTLFAPAFRWFPAQR